jgi:hypothetical protein
LNEGVEEKARKETTEQEKECEGCWEARELDESEEVKEEKAGLGELQAESLRQSAARGLAENRR